MRPFLKILTFLFILFFLPQCTRFEIDHQAGDSGELLEIQFRSTHTFDCESIDILQGTLAFEDPTILQIEEVQFEGNMDDFYTEYDFDKHSFFIYAFGETPWKIQKDDVLFTLYVRITGEPGDCSKIFVLGNELPNEYICVKEEGAEKQRLLVRNGRVCIDASADLKGQIVSTFNASQGVANMHLNLTEADDPDFSQLSTSTSTGHFSFADIPNAGVYIIKPFKDGDASIGLSNKDAAIIKNHIDGIDLITNPHLQVAADCNCDHKIDMADYDIVVQSIAEQSPHFPNNCASWTFVQKGYPFGENVFNYPSAHLFDTLTIGLSTGYDFVAIKRGDMTGDAYALHDANADKLATPDAATNRPIANKGTPYNAPNPFWEFTTINFQLEKAGNTRITIRNQMGQVVQQEQLYLLEGTQHYLFHPIRLDAGIYFYQIETNTEQQTGKMIYVNP